MSYETFGGANAPSTCPQCGIQNADGAPAGLCAKCLLQLGFDSVPNPTQSMHESYKVPFVAPLPEHLAPQFPNLQIVDRIGYGGMGVVYRAEQIPLGRTVALKILRPDLSQDPSFAERFQREAQLLGRLQHPNIVNIFDFGQNQDLFYLIMEYVEGANLRQLQHAGQLGPTSALSLVPQICGALEYAHSNGVVHRDIKPENILVNSSGQVKIADFGLAKMGGMADESALTRMGQVMGTPHYMAPEQVEHPQEVDHRADIYSLGVVIYEMLTGELPLGRFAAPSNRAAVDKRFDNVVLKALEKEPEERYQQVMQVRSDLEHVKTRNPYNFNQREGGERKFTAKNIWGERGIGWCAATMKWMAAIELVIGLFCIWVSFFENDFIVGVVFSGFFGAVGIVTANLLRYREFGALTLLGSLVLMIPAPAMVLRIIPGVWSLILVVRHWRLFTWPKLRESQALKHLLGYVARPFRWLGTKSPDIDASVRSAQQAFAEAAEVVSDRIPAAAETTKSWISKVRGMLASMLLFVFRSIGIRTLGFSVLLLVAWTAVCGSSVSMMLYTWGQQYAPRYVYTSDQSADTLQNPFGFYEFGIKTTSRGTEANPSIRNVGYDEIRVVARAKDRSASTLIISPDDVGPEELRYVPNSYSWSIAGLPTEELVGQWLAHATQEQQLVAADVKDESRQLAIKDLTGSLKQLALRTFESREAMTNKPVVSFVKLDSFPMAVGQRRGSLYINESESAEAMIASFAIPASSWLFGFFGLLPFVISIFRPSVSMPRRFSTLATGISFSMASLCCFFALGIFVLQQLISNRNSWSMGEQLSEQFYWFVRPESLELLAANQLALCVVTVLFLALTASRSFNVTRIVPAWPIAGLIALAAFGATFWNLSQMPWLHYLPLLIPIWLAVVSLPVILVADYFGGQPQKEEA